MKLKKQIKSKTYKKNKQKGGKLSNKKHNKYKIIVVEKKSKPSKLKKMINKGNWLILHHSHSSYHCVEMFPLWEQFKKSKPTINILEVEGQFIDYVKLPEPIYYVPTIHFYNKSKKHNEQFKGKITSNRLKRFIKKHKNKIKTIQKGSGEFKIIDKNIKNTYNKDLLNNGKWMILYHSHSCPHCLIMIDEWNKFKTSNPPINILEIEANDLNYIEPPTNVMGFPTILFLDKDNITEFSGERTYDNFLKFMNNNK